MGKLQVNYEILNQKNTPAFYASSLATRPTAGFSGRVFIDTDSPSTGIYRDTGSAWIRISDPAPDTIGTLQTVTTNGNTSNTGISVTANGIGIGTTIPGSNRLDIHASSGIQATFNGTGVTNAALQLESAGVGKWHVRNNYNAGTNDFGIFDVLNSIDRVKITNAGVISLTGITNISSRLNLNGATDNSLYQLNVTGAGFFSGAVDALSLNLVGQLKVIAPVTSAIDVRGIANSLSIYTFDMIASSRAGNGLVGRFGAVSGLSNGYTISVNNTNNGLLHNWNGIATFENSVNIGNSVAAAIAAPSTHKVSILIGGVQYYLLASNV